MKKIATFWQARDGEVLRPTLSKILKAPRGELIQQKTSERICEVFFWGGKLWWLICEMLDSVD